jgi:hypothetical protein
MTLITYMPHSIRLDTTDHIFVSVLFYLSSIVVLLNRNESSLYQRPYFKFSSLINAVNNKKSQRNKPLLKAAYKKKCLLFIIVKLLLCHYCHVYECDYRRILDWWQDLLGSAIQGVTTLYSSLLHIHWCPQSLLHCRCLVAAFNDRCFPSSGFPNCIRPQLPTSYGNSSERPRRFPLLLYSLASVETCLFVKPLLSNGCCTVAYFSIVA